MQLLHIDMEAWCMCVRFESHSNITATFKKIVKSGASEESLRTAHASQQS